MAFDNLGQFIEALEGAGELRRIGVEIDPKFEITEVADRCMKSPGGGPALLFEKVSGSRIPLAINLFGSKKRMSTALQVQDLDEVGARITKLLNPKVPEGLLNKLSLLPQLFEMAKFPPRRVRSAPCQEIILRDGEVDLGILPIITCWPQDGGPYITLPMVITRDPETGTRNVGCYRIQVFESDKVAMHWQRHKGSARHFDLHKRLGQRMEVAVALGGDPATMYSPTAPLPPSIDEFLFAGFLRSKPVRLVKGVTVDLEVPAESEIVLEGYVDPDAEMLMEGPFGDHTGFYSLPDRYPALNITAITMKKDPVYPTTIVGWPPMEDYYLGHATERIFLPLSRLIMPEIVDYHMPPEGIFHNLIFVAIDKQYPGHAYKVMNGLWGQGLLMLAKIIIVVDKDVNVQDPVEAWCTVLNHIDPRRDVHFTPGPVDVLDHASSSFSYGSKMGIDGTRKWPEEGFTRDWPDRIVMSEDVKKRIDQVWDQLGIS